MSAEKYYEAIDQALDDNEIEDRHSNTQESDADFNRDYDPIQSSIADLTAYFDEIFLKRAVIEKTTSPKISMDAGCLILEGSQDENEYDIFISATHAEHPKGISREILAKVW